MATENSDLSGEEGKAGWYIVGHCLSIVQGEEGEAGEGMLLLQ